MKVIEMPAQPPINTIICKSCGCVLFLQPDNLICGCLGEHSEVVERFQSELSGKCYETEAEARNDEAQISPGKLLQLQKRIASDVPWVPEVGDVVYVGTSIYIDHGEDDVEGGLAIVTEIKFDSRANGGDHCISTAQHDGHDYYWKFLQDKQKYYMERYGIRIAYPDPERSDMSFL